MVCRLDKISLTIEKSKKKSKKFQFISTENYQWWDVCIGNSSKSKNLSIAATSYALLSMTLAGQEDQCMPIVKWLLSKRNSYGGFEGAQDTIIGIEALATFASKLSKIDSKTDIILNPITENTLSSHQMHLTKDNALVPQSKKVRNNFQHFLICFFFE